MSLNKIVKKTKTEIFALRVKIFEPIKIKTHCAPQNDHLKLRFLKDVYVKISESWKRFMVSSILPKNERKNLTLLLWYLRSNCFRLFFERIEETINCFRHLLTFSWQKMAKYGRKKHLSVANFGIQSLGT